MTSPERVVFDCNVYFQALISPAGPANRLLSLVFDRHASLYASAFVFSEVQSLFSDKRIRIKYCLDGAKVEGFLAAVRQYAIIIEAVPHVFDFPRDPDDAHYVDLAVAVDAKLIVSRDKDLLSLRDISQTEGRDFLNRFPDLLILTPPEALNLLDDSSTPLE
jgi:putative PIN family toxin of toxin-antitoxin system